MNNILKKVTDVDIVDGYYTIPDGVTKIGWRAFEEFKSLKSIIIPDSVTEIGWYAFKGCKSLRSISLPKNVKLDNNVFDGCSTDLKIEYR